MNRKWLFWIPVLLWMGLIFYSSAQPYKKQDMRSDIEQYVNVEFVKEHFHGYLLITAVVHLLALQIKV